MAKNGIVEERLVVGWDGHLLIRSPVMRLLHFTWALCLALAVPLAAQQAPPARAGQAESRTYIVFLQGSPIGREQVTFRSDASGMTVDDQAQLGAPVNMSHRSEAHYTADWMPQSLLFEGTQNGQAFSLRTRFQDGSAVTEGTDAERAVNVTRPFTDRSFMLPNMFFAAHEALGRRLTAAGNTGGEYRAWFSPGGEVPFTVRSVAMEQMQRGTVAVPVRRYDLVFSNQAGQLSANLVTDERGAFIRFTVPAQGLDVLRDDFAASSARTDVYSVPGDEAVMIPAAGFNIGATITHPQNAGAMRLPTVVLLSGSGIVGRDGYAAGVPIQGQLARVLSQAGFIVVRYDKRGTGQSGGRGESVTLSDYADDARAVIDWLSKRKDVDDDRIAVVGHSEGSWVALLAASREKKIAAVVAIAAPSSTGADLILEQQAHALDLLNVSPAVRAERIALQKKIHNAVLTGTGWEGIPPAARRQADTPWFQSLLAFDPAKVVDDVKQPMLFIQGDLDRQVPIDHLARIAGLARRTSKSKSVESVQAAGVNHLLIPAKTGEVSEYVSLPDKNLSAEVTGPIAAWLKKTFAAIR
jgi:pimeloyl-ACP methyl ester carboxylesterase